MTQSFTGPAVIVDPYSSGALFAPTFKELGVSVIAVVSALKPPEVYASSYRPNDFDDIILADESHFDEAIEKLKVLHPRCILTGCESGVELTDAIAPLVLPEFANDPYKKSARRHKGHMAEAVAAANLASIKQICSANADEVEKWINQNGLVGKDLIIKPPKSASTDGVTRVERGENWRIVFDSMINQANRLGIINETLVVQEFSYGTEYVVDTMSYEGNHCICNICQYKKTTNGPHVAIYDAMTWMPSNIEEYDSLTEYARGVLDAVGMRFGTAHVEIMMTSEGPKLIEIGARPHGGGHPQFNIHATGDTQVHRIVRYFTNHTPIPNSFNLLNKTKVVFLISRQSGYVKNGHLLTAVKDLASHYHSSIHFQDGDYLKQTDDLFASLELGFVVLSSPDDQQLQNDYQKIRYWESQLEFSDKELSKTDEVRTELA